MEGQGGILLPIFLSPLPIVTIFLHKIPVSDKQEIFISYRYALELEEAEVHCYQNMLEKIRAKGMKNLLRTIVEEENRHVEDFRSVYDFINAPNQYLAWGEFSNLAEFHQFGRNVD